MPLYIYKAVDKDGKHVYGELTMPSKKEVVAELSDDGLVPLSVEEKRAGGVGSDMVLFARVTALDKILFTRHLAATLKAGIGLAEALDIIATDHKKPLMRKVIREAQAGIQRGEMLSDVFSRYPQYFSPVFLGLVRAGELSGTLDAAFDNLSTQLFRDYDLLKRVRLAMVYPLILLTGSAGIIVLLLTFVLPRMAKAFRGVVAEMPFLTQLLIDVSNAFSRNPYFTITLFIGLLVGGWYLSRTLAGKRILFRIFERLPVSSELIQKLALARFSRTFRNLLSTGVGAIDALNIAAATISNPTYEKEFLVIVEELKRGSNLSDAFRFRPHLFPSFFTSLVMIGERTGTLEHSFATVGAFYDEEVDRVLKTLVSLLEPVLLLIMGVVVALVALAVLLPIFRLVRSVQG